MAVFTRPDPLSRPQQINFGSFVASIAIVVKLALDGPSQMGVANIFGAVVGYVVAFIVVLLFQMATTRGQQSEVLEDERDALYEARSYKVAFGFALLPIILWLVEAGRASVGAGPMLIDIANPSHGLFVTTVGLFMAETARSFAALFMSGRG